MLSKKARISKQVFKELKRPEKTLYSDNLTLRIFAGPDLVKPKFSVSVSKKIEKKAVLRNLMRRLSYDTIRDNNKLSKKLFVHFIFNSKPANLKLQIPNEIKLLLEKI